MDRSVGWLGAILESAIWVVWTGAGDVSWTGVAVQLTIVIKSRKTAVPNFFPILLSAATEKDLAVGK